MIQDIHTTDLTTACLRRVQLTHEGKRKGEATTALFMGLLFHAACQRMHEAGIWSDPGECIEQVRLDVLRGLADESRPLTDSVKANRKDLEVEVSEWLRRYALRFSGYFGAAKLIGCELPVRYTMSVDGTDQEFASHIDLLYRAPAGELIVRDWKTGGDSPTQHFLDRNLQTGLYHLCLKYGAVQLPDAGWVEFAEHPGIEWVHIRNLMPYAKATETKDDGGTLRQFKKGDDRPLRTIVRNATVFNEQAVVDELATRVRMFRAGLYPTNPTPEGCHICECSEYCPSWQQDAAEDHHADE